MSAAISSSGTPSPAVRMMNPPVVPDPVGLQDSLQPLPLLLTRDFSRYTQMADARHKNDIPAGQGDVRSDAGSLLPQRLFGDLNDDFLPRLQQIADGGQHALGLLGRAVLLGKGSPSQCVALDSSRLP